MIKQLRFKGRTEIERELHGTHKTLDYTLFKKNLEFLSKRNDKLHIRKFILRTFLNR